MNRTLTYQISAPSDGLQIKQYLRHRGFSRQNLTELKKMPDSVLVDGTPRRLCHLLTAGEVLTIHIRELECSKNVPPIDIPLHIVYEDEDIVVINKDAGMPIHPSLNHYTYSVANGLAYYYQAKGQPFVFRCVNRLDQDTSGLTVVAKHMVSANLISQMAKNKVIRREYLAIVKGMVTPASGIIDAPLSRKPGSIIERIVDFERGERAVTHYRTLKEERGHSLVLLELETGRTHQIRIHMKHLGFPLIGDYLYNPDMSLISRQALHSWRLSFPHPITGESMTFTASLPEDMARIIQLSDSAVESA
ncbi:RluA family pseudouridine synthase [Hespellia stercorisuis]|uniref:Pseudouridine synthase n=1 Tax=Hespellia stercorisuis DSM 15480 TaxID=1121950 RepID=A0A1M6U7C7_9FIRM|nr:RluA family pseudouridine synthase [Hespellia stercorisuis]SHK65097.1 23S rRNA pseudouridine1911/1915/1917 synthase [Hespellia stercorisuis DSM 15480]